jgi:hypothetical protein
MFTTIEDEAASLLVVCSVFEWYCRVVLDGRCSECWAGCSGREVIHPAAEHPIDLSGRRPRCLV